MPCSCASAKPSGCSSPVAGERECVVERLLRLPEELRVERGRLGGQRESGLEARIGRRGRAPLAPRGRSLDGIARARRGHAGRDQSQPLRRRHRRLLGGGRGECALDDVPHELVQRAGIAEAHLGLLRMDVHVHAARIEREPQRVRRRAVVVQHVAVGLAQRVREHAVAHEASVDEDVLRRARLRGVRGTHCVALQPHSRPLRPRRARRGAGTRRPAAPRPGPTGSRAAGAPGRVRCAAP